MVQISHLTRGQAAQPKNTNSAPSPKRQEKEAQDQEPQTTEPKTTEPATTEPSQVLPGSHVYIVTVTTYDRDGEENADVRSVHATQKDANNAVKKLVNEEYHGIPGERDVDEGGFVTWSSDAGMDMGAYYIKAEEWTVSEEVEDVEWDPEEEDEGDGEEDENGEEEDGEDDE